MKATRIKFENGIRIGQGETVTDLPSADHRRKGIDHIDVDIDPSGILSFLWDGTRHLVNGNFHIALEESEFQSHSLAGASEPGSRAGRRKRSTPPAA